MSWITKSLSWINNTLTPYPDTKPDPEDKAAYDHFTLLAKAFEDNGIFQILRDGKKPSDVSKSLEDLKLAAAPYPFWVDIYEGSKGKGFVVNYEVERGTFLSKKKYVKRINIGPETEREQDWTEVSPAKMI